MLIILNIVINKCFAFISLEKLFQFISLFVSFTALLSTVLVIPNYL